MVRKIYRFAVVLCMLSLGWNLWADDDGIVLLPAFSVRQTTGLLGGNQAEYLFKFAGGYRLASGWYFGMIYSQVNANGADSLAEWAVGNSVGYFYGGFSLIGSLYLAANNVERTAASTVHRSQGFGTQLDLSYMVQTPHGFGIGPTLTFRSISYGVQDDNTGTVQATNHADTYLYPYAGFIILF